SSGGGAADALRARTPLAVGTGPHRRETQMTDLPRKGAIIGAGDIGCGWAALCVPAGWPVTVYDTNARAIERASEQIPRRSRALVALERAGSAMVERGLLELKHARSLLQAVNDADWIIEAISEDLFAKQRLLGAIQDV